MKEYSESWGNLQQKAQPYMKKMKDHQLFNETIVNGNWGHGVNNNLGFFGFTGTPQENAEIGKLLGGSNGRSTR
jgi:hypothetical protein